MVRGVQDILTWFGNSKLPYWRIYPHKNIQSGNIVMQSDQREDQPHGDALQDLQYKLRCLHRGTFTLVAYPNADKLPTKGYWYTEIEITAADTAAIHPAAVSGPPGLSEADVSKRIEDALHKYKQEQEFVDLKKKFTELEKEKKQLEKSVNDPWNKFIGALAPYSDKIVGSIFPQQQVAGIPAPDNGPEDNMDETTAPDTTDLTESQTQTLSDFVTVLAHNDQDWENTLKRLTKAINDKPSLIGMVKSFV